MRNRSSSPQWWKGLGDIFTLMVVVFVITMVILTIVAYIQEAFAYNFVKCPDDNNTYPEGTDCNPEKWEEPLESTQKGDRPD